MKIGKYIFSENSTNYINDESNFDLISNVELMFGLLLAAGIAVVFLIGLITIIELSGCI